MVTARKSLTDDTIDLGDFVEVSQVRPALLYIDASAFAMHTTNFTEQFMPSMYADFDASKARTDSDKLRNRLIAAVRSMQVSAPTWDGGTAKVEAGAAVAAEMFLACLPENRVLPKVAADGEGDVMFVWDSDNRSCILTVEAKSLHLVRAPGTAQAEHVDARPFYGEHVPVSILRHLPMK